MYFRAIKYAVFKNYFVLEFAAMAFEQFSCLYFANIFADTL